MFKEIKFKNSLVAFAGSAIQAFGIYNIHSLSKVTEGGVLGATLLIEYWFDISPAVSGFILNAACYLLGFRYLGKKFIYYSLIASAGFSLSYAFFEQFDPIWPQISNMPLLASIIGALFIGIGAGLAVKSGGATCGDDALAMSASSVFHIDIQWIYLITDTIVLILSLSYIPATRILYSFLTVFISGQIIGYIQKL